MKVRVWVDAPPAHDGEHRVHEEALVQRVGEQTLPMLSAWSASAGSKVSKPPAGKSSNKTETSLEEVWIFNMELAADSLAAIGEIQFSAFIA